MNDVIERARQEVAELRSRITMLDDDALDLVVRKARSHHKWTDRPVSDAQLRQIFDIAKRAPTAFNSNPMRIVFVRTQESKARLAPALTGPNVPKMEAAPVTAILAYDMKFYEHFGKLHPHKAEVAEKFRSSAAKAQESAFRNSSIQGAFFIIAVRAIGLDAGPMSGFDNAVVDEEFFKGTSLKSNFLCNIGYADEAGLFQRLPRFDFEEICDIV
jgi:3-hydroxypropanoate dehydrogenase